MARLKAAFVFLAVVATAEAQWTVGSEKSEPGRAGIVHRHISAENAGTGRSADLDLALFSAKVCTLRIIDNQNQASDLAETIRRVNLAAGVNGGYFDPNFAPIGLRIIDGKTTSPLVRARLITGVVLASPRGIQIVRTSKFSRKQSVTAALQCGPFLVEDGRGLRGLDDSRPARRTFVMTASGDRAGVGACSNISLAQMADLLATIHIADDFKIQQALNLDGGSSTAFWFAREKGAAFSISEQKSVRDFVAVEAR